MSQSNEGKMNMHIDQADLNALAKLLATKPLEAGIDTSALITMLGFVAAAWAVGHHARAARTGARLLDSPPASAITCRSLPAFSHDK